MTLHNRFDRLLKAMAFGEAPRLKSNDDVEGDLSKVPKSLPKTKH